MRDVLGRGGMGVVYKALDTLMKREVALKTILDIDNPASADLFYKEWSILATMVHPNVIGIYDIGEFEEDGMKKPFFVMPMLPGVALDRLIRDGSPRLTPENVVNIIDQACRGLHAAHEQGLVHRDVKPSNIFVMDDDSVKIIDFGIARVASTSSKTSIKGTLFYLAPEFLENKPPTPLSDQFALAVAAYEGLTRRRPFDGASDAEVFEAIRRYSPPPASEVNPNVNYAISQVIHKAMAKQPYHRFLTIREFGDALQKAKRNEPLELYDNSKTKPRLEKARQSFEQGDYNFALEILAELETEGRLDQEVGLLRRQVDQAVRHTRIRQLLESARRFFEAEEYPVALRKIQDALDLDPEDTDALSLKSQIERERREKKIEEWIQLAHQHLDNQAFSQARDALNNVLNLKPNDTVALALVADVGRREREVAQVREEKGRLYQAAMQAWDKGDVTSALSKLENLMKLDRDLPDADAGRTGSYHVFYNQVHSEHNSIKNSYEEAKRSLANENYEGAMATCRQYLAKYPNHALFQALKFDIDERQRQALSAVIAETDRRVEEEADLHRRVGILDEVLKLYPGEPHFERALKQVHDKRDLVNSIVSKARYFEERGQFNEALDQWQILRSIHERHPGLAFEIERLMKKRDQQARENAKAMWVQQTDRYLEAGEYDRAVRTVESALGEFPGEPDLLELNNVARKGQARAAEAQQLLAYARELSEKTGLEASLDPLRQAAELDPRNTVIRTVLVNSLLADSRRLMQIPDWENAEARLRELLTLEPNHAGAQSLASEFADRKREEFVSLCITHARRFQAEGDIGRALSVVAQGLQAYPSDPRFEQLQATLQRAQAEAPRQTGTRETTMAGAGGTATAKPPEAPAGAQPTPPPPSAPGSAFSATAILGAAQAPASPAGASPEIPRIAPPAPAKPGKPAAAIKMPAIPAKNLMYAGMGLAAVVGVIAIGAMIARSRRQPPPRPVVAATFKVVLRSSPEGAAIAVDGKPCGTSTCEMQLPQGNHRAEATLAGYQNATSEFAVTASAAPEIRLTLEAPPAQISLSTDLTDGTLSVDGVAAAQIQGGETEVPRLAPGQHKLEIQSNGAKATLALAFTSGALPKLTAPIQAQGVNAVVISRYGALATVYCNTEGVPTAVDGKLAGAAGNAGLELKDLAPGPHEIAITINGLMRRFPFESSATSGIVASLFTERNVGSVRILTGDDGVAVYLNGQKFKRTTTRGRLLLFLAPKQYTVRVEKPGLWAADQTVDVRRGEEAQVTFKLAPAKGTLEIHGAPPGTEVWLDGAQIGSARDGAFSSAAIEPGKHTVALKHDRFKPLQGDYVFEPGKPISVDGTLQSAAGSLKIDVSPAGIEGLQVRILREGETQERTVAETELSLAEGTYRVTGSAPQYVDAVATVHVAVGRGVTATLAMKRPEKTPVQTQAKQTAFSMEVWAKAGGAAPSPSSWTREDKLWVKRGGEFVVAPINPAAGAYYFTAIVMKGKRLEWVLNYKDDKNYDLFQLEDKNLVRTQYVNGKKGESVKSSHPIKAKDYVSVMIAITPGAIVHSFFVQQQWQAVDKWERQGGGLQGKFGFHVPGKDQIGVSDFRFTPN